MFKFESRFDIVFDDENVCFSNYKDPKKISLDALKQVYARIIREHEGDITATDDIEGGFMVFQTGMRMWINIHSPKDFNKTIEVYFGVLFKGEEDNLTGSRKMLLEENSYFEFVTGLCDVGGDKFKEAESLAHNLDGNLKLGEHSMINGKDSYDWTIKSKAPAWCSLKDCYYIISKYLDKVLKKMTEFATSTGLF